MSYDTNKEAGAAHLLLSELGVLFDKGGSVLSLSERIRILASNSRQAGYKAGRNAEPPLCKCALRKSTKEWYPED